MIEAIGHAERLFCGPEPYHGGAGMKDDLQRFAMDVSAIMMDAYGLSWLDAAGDLQPLENAVADGLSPRQFVEMFAAKYGLVPRSNDW
jgi:hypothetical protein